MLQFENVGIAESGSLAIPGADDLFSGPTPAPAHDEYIVAAVVDWPMGTVLGADPATRILSAFTGAVGQVAVGIAPFRITRTEVTAKPINIFVAGCFNPAALTWDDAVLVADRKVAFQESVGGSTNIVLRAKVGVAVA